MSSHLPYWMPLSTPAAHMARRPVHCSWPVPKFVYNIYILAHSIYIFSCIDFFIFSDYLENNYLGIYWNDFHDFFNQIIIICTHMIDLNRFSDPLKDVAMATNIRAKFRCTVLFSWAAFQNGLQYLHTDSKMYNGNVLCTFCASWMKMSPVTPEITRVTNAPFWMRLQKSTYLTEYHNNYWSDLYQRLTIGRRMHRNYKTDISFGVVQGTFLW